MKLIKKRIFSFSASLIIAISAMSVISSPAFANSNQKVWYSNSSNPAVKVYIKGSFVYAQISNRSLDMPVTKLKYVSGNLLNEFGADYIHIKDFSHNGLLDIGVLTSVGYGGSNRCYKVYEYSPKFYVYKSRAKKTVCFE